MSTVVMPSFQEVEEVLHETPLQMHPSQAHGHICAEICTASQNSINEWQKWVIGEENRKNIPESIQILYDVSAAQLGDFMLEFNLLLPEDSQSMKARVEALVLWCQGYVTGLEVAHVSEKYFSKTVINETIHDLLEISHLNQADVSGDEQDEVAYMELVEYVRMAVIFLYQELRASADSSSESLH